MKEQEAYWVRAKEAVTRDVEGEIFLAMPRDGSLHTLNPMASALWRALAIPRTWAELCTLVEAAFPAVDAAMIRDDIQAILQTFESNGLAQRASRR